MDKLLKIITRSFVVHAKQFYAAGFELLDTILQRAIEAELPSPCLKKMWLVEAEMS